MQVATLFWHLHLLQGQLRVALRMAHDALQGKPLPDVAEQPVSPRSVTVGATAAGAPAAGLPPMPQPPQAGAPQRQGLLSAEEVEAQIARFQVWPLS